MTPTWSIPVCGAGTPRLASALLLALLLAPVTSAQCGYLWQPLGTGLGASGSTVGAVATFPDNSIVAYADGLLPSFMRWDGTAWRAFGSPNLDAGVWSLVRLANNDLLVGGSFRNIGGIQANRIARWNGTTWSTLGTGIDQSIVSRVNAIVEMPNGDIVIGGWFSTAGSVSANKIARWNGSAWSPLGTGMDANVYALAALPNGQLVAGGNFTLAGGTPVNNIALWDGTSWSAMQGGVNNTVAALATLPGGAVLVGGSFTSAGVVAASRIAQWTGGAWSPLGAGVSGPVNAIVVRGAGDVIVGGGFTTAGGRPASLVARWTGSRWSPVGSGLDRAPLFGTEVVACLATRSNGDLVAGGSFTAGGGAPLQRIARFSAGCPSTVASYGPVCAGTAGPVLLDATTLPVLGYSFTLSATGFAPGALGLRMIGTTQTAVPMRSLHPAGQLGCELSLAPDILFEPASPSAGALAVTVPIPNATSLIGLVAYAQAGAIEFSGTTIALIATSNGVRFTVGTF